MKLSVIIAVYQAQATLIRCIKSVERALDRVHSRYEIDGEIILVNDGSTDDSLLVSKTLAKKYNNIRIISHEKRGIARARNEALSLVSGDFVCFVDPEDELIERYFINMYGAMKSDTSLVTALPNDINALLKRKKINDFTIETTWDAIDKLIVDYSYNTVKGTLFRKIFINHLFQEDKDPLSESCFLVDYLYNARGLVKVLTEQQYENEEKNDERVNLKTLIGIKEAYLYILDRMNERGCKKKEILLLKYLDNYMRTFHKLSIEEQTSAVGKEMLERFATERKIITKDMHMSILESIYYFTMLRGSGPATVNTLK